MGEFGGRDPRLDTDLSRKALDRVKDYPEVVEAVKKLCYVSAGGDGFDALQATRKLNTIVSLDNKSLKDCVDSFMQDIAKKKEKKVAKKRSNAAVR